ncbi:unnamed protein product [Parnassius mnemosyne]|uniref:Gag-like protein n=1 Tax=Parnassius mnemosyne TaxID=213953 RepID=A0AAV1M1M0_9NEOP
MGDETGSPREKPPDPPDEDMCFGVSDNNDCGRGKKRHAETRSFDPVIYKKNSVIDLTASINTIYKHPCLEQNLRMYGPNDQGPFIVHISRATSDPRIGLSLRPIKIGLCLSKNKIENIKRGGVKSVGRNRISIEFCSADEANKFLNNPMLAKEKLIATIPSYNVSRMGVIRGIPVDWSMEELAEAVELPPGCGKILKARRLQRKTFAEGSTSPIWVPTQSIVLTFEGQLLPKYIYAFYTSLAVETYQLPSIQCKHCCRFGHIADQCRSKPRCFRCAQEHTGASCSVPESEATCLLCSKNHFANNKNCPEHQRQISIKVMMSEQNISYIEASAKIPSIRLNNPQKPYSEVASTQLSPTPTTSFNLPTMSQAYRKTIFKPPRPIPRIPMGYDQQAHQRIVADCPSSTPNGCALSNTHNQISPNENLVECLISLLNNLILKMSDSLPNNVAEKIFNLASLIDNINDSNKRPPSPSMEL